MSFPPNSTGRDAAETTHLRFGLLVFGIVAGLCVTRLYSYLLFHTVVELFTIAVAWSMFFLAWNARRHLDNHYVLFIAVASFGVAGIDLVHALTYRGMDVFGPHGSNLATQLWMAGRYVQTSAFLAAPLFISRKLRPTAALCAVLLISLAVIVSGLRHLLPDCYVEGVGLTPFKVVSEYVVTAALLVSMGLLWRRRAAFAGNVRVLLLAAIAVTAAGELLFTLYTDVYGLFNMAGHLLRFVAFCFFCRAIIVIGLVRPYDLLFRNLALSEERYRAFVENSADGICRIEFAQSVPLSLPAQAQLLVLLRDGMVAESNETFARLYGRERSSSMAGARLGEVLGPDPAAAELLGALIRSEYRGADAELDRKLADGNCRHLETAVTGVVERGRLIRIWIVSRDVTERRRAAIERERLISELRGALAEVKTLSGLLPICAKCKKIRDDQGYWTRVETYIQQRADVSFTHGICPGCARELYPEMYHEMYRAAGAGE